MPRNPSRLQSTLQSLQPIVLFISYDCLNGCRSRGICLHFQFLLCGRSGPDGLICHMCRDGGREEGYRVARQCCKHSTDLALNRPEDMPANYRQLVQAEKLLMAAWANNWQDNVHQNHANHLKALALLSSDATFQQRKIRGLASISEQYDPSTSMNADCCAEAGTAECSRNSHDKENTKENKPVFQSFKTNSFADSALDMSATQPINCADEHSAWSESDAAIFGNDSHAYNETEMACAWLSDRGVDNLLGTDLEV